MLCSKCMTEARNGKVIKAVFICDKCGAAAKRSALDNQIKERYQQIYKDLYRAQSIMGIVSNNLFDLQEYLKENGIEVNTPHPPAPHTQE
jgi:hypothetical protein